MGRLAGGREVSKLGTASNPTSNRWFTPTHTQGVFYTSQGLIPQLSYNTPAPSPGKPPPQYLTVAS